MGHILTVMYLNYQISEYNDEYHNVKVLWCVFNGMYHIIYMAVYGALKNTMI